MKCSDITKETLEVVKLMQDKVEGQKIKILYPVTNYKKANDPFIVMTQYGEIKVSKTRFFRKRYGEKKGIVLDMRSVIDKSDFLKRQLSEIFGNKYTYDKVRFKGMKERVRITCKTHGDFEVTPDNALHGKSGCPMCGKRMMTQDEFTKRVKKVHNNYYTYEKLEYYKQVEKIMVTCPYHGDFKIVAMNHMNGSGCSDCTKRDGWYDIKTAESKKEEWKNREAILYLVRLSDGNEVFDKVGITINSVKQRYYSFHEYDVKIIDTINTNLYDACYMEHDIKRNNVKYKYIPNKSFGGMYECFNTNKITLN